MAPVLFGLCLHLPEAHPVEVAKMTSSYLCWLWISFRCSYFLERCGVEGGESWQVGVTRGSCRCCNFAPGFLTWLVVASRAEVAEPATKQPSPGLKIQLWNPTGGRMGIW